MTKKPNAKALDALPARSLAVADCEVWRRRDDGLWDCLSMDLRPKDSLSLAILGARIVDRPDVDVIAEAEERGAREATARGQAGVDEWFGGIVMKVIDVFEEADWEQPDVAEIRASVFKAVGITERAL